MKKLIVSAVLMSLLVMTAVPTFAQQSTPLVDTITVIGTGSVSGTPDIANIEVAVERFNPELSVAFSSANDTIAQIIEAVVASGVAREDVRTTGLGVYQDRYGYPPYDAASGEEPTPVYVVNNGVRIVVRDIDAVSEVLDVAIAAGATNIYGLNFDIAERAELQSEARALALEDARARAAELADLAGVELGDILIITEGGEDFSTFYPREYAMGMGGGGGAVIEPGQTSVGQTLRVTFAINR